MTLQFLPPSIPTAAKVRSVLKQLKFFSCVFVAETLPATLALPFLHNSVHLLLQWVRSLVSTESLIWLLVKTMTELPLSLTADGSEMECE